MLRHARESDRVEIEGGEVNRAYAVILAIGIALQLPVTAEQLRFSAMDERLEHEVAMPPPLAELLARDPYVKGLLEYEGRPTDKVPGEWFKVSEVHLHTDREKDIIVMGTGPVLGANVTTFWIFRPKNGKFESLLNPAAAALDLEVKKTRSKGYRDIELFSATAITVSTVLCRFDGSTYKPANCSLQPSK